MTGLRGGAPPVVLLGLALGVELWALQTYGLGVDPDLVRLQQVLFAAHLPMVVAALRRTPPSPSGLVRALLPSLLAVVACTVVASWAAQPAPSPAALLDGLAATTFGWLCVGSLLAALLARVRPVPAGTDPSRTPVERLLRLATAVLTTALGLTMPATSRGLLERDRLGMLDQVHAVVTGFGDPAAVHLVVTYAVLLVVLLVIAHRLGMSRGGAG